MQQCEPHGTAQRFSHPTPSGPGATAEEAGAHILHQQPWLQVLQQITDKPTSGMQQLQHHDLKNKVSVLVQVVKGACKRTERSEAVLDEGGSLESSRAQASRGRGHRRKGPRGPVSQRAPARIPIRLADLQRGRGGLSCSQPFAKAGTWGKVGVQSGFVK